MEVQRIVCWAFAWIGKASTETLNIFHNDFYAHSFNKCNFFAWHMKMNSKFWCMGYSALDRSPSIKCIFLFHSHRPHIMVVVNVINHHSLTLRKCSVHCCSEQYWTSACRTIPLEKISRRYHRGAFARLSIIVQTAIVLSYGVARLYITSATPLFCISGCAWQTTKQSVAKPSQKCLNSLTF